MARKKMGLPGVAEANNPQEDAFLRAILEEPDDDTHRLVYADWLMDQDNPRGEFIRCQVLAAQKKTSAPDKKKFKKRASELLLENEWLPDLFDSEDTAIDRGFVTTMALSVDLDHEEDFRSIDAELAPFAADPFFALTAAFVSFDYEFPTLYSIPARLPRLGAMGKINWEGCVFGCIGENDGDADENPLAALMLGSPHLAGLRELRMAACGLQDGALKALADNSALTSLRVLDLGSDHGMEVSGNYFSDAGVVALANSPHLAGVESLDLSDGGVGEAGFRALCAVKFMKNLRRLDLFGVGMTDRDYQTLATSPLAAQLSHLRIGKAYYQSQDLPGEVGVMALVNSPGLANIQELTLNLYELPDHVKTALRERFGERVKLPD